MPYVGGRVASLVRPAIARHACRQMAKRGGARFTELVKENTPIAPPPTPLELRHRRPRRRPGTLRDSWQQKEVLPLPGGGGFHSGVETDDPIAPFVEWSTRPHLIEPNPPNTRLAFVKDGRWWFPRVVKHPGTHGQAMVRISAAKLESEFGDALFERELAEWKRLSELGL